MTTYFIRICFPIFLCAHSLNAQQGETGYWQPAIAVNYKVGGAYSHNFSLANRNYIYRDNDFQLTTRQLDVVHFSKFKTSIGQSLALGIQYRFRQLFEDAKGNELRLVQQYNLTNEMGPWRMGHRFRSEQRFVKEATLHRLRYRLAFDRPLKGQNLDTGEAYCVVSTELLATFASSRSPQFDQRIGLGLGWLLGQGTKLQNGFGYRWENFGQVTVHSFFLHTALILSL
ncbi:MAG: DUF2490 domain-containing protein [Flavobacteriaceae bacterium]